MHFHDLPIWIVYLSHLPTKTFMSNDHPINKYCNINSMQCTHKLYYNIFYIFLEIHRRVDNPCYM